MTKTLYAQFDGETLHPEEEIPVLPNTRVRVTVETLDKPEELVEQKGEPYVFFKTALSLRLEGPPDWAENLDEYLYGGREFPE
ncbi:MAG TPA: hypothetical protein VJ885_15925 [Thermoanaerobaculia bacterium]|nr:hypothetical protein [Thermoanaerobaculia bacterium]